jgi:hypothetical protein
MPFWLSYLNKNYQKQAPAVTHPSVMGLPGSVGSRNFTPRKTATAPGEESRFLEWLKKQL